MRHSKHKAALAVLVAASFQFSGESASAGTRDVATWYGKQYHGRRTASGERFDMYANTAAHRTLPFGTRLRVRNPGNGRSILVRVNDRGPHNRRATIDLSYAAARKLGIVRRGFARVEIERARR